MALGDVVRAWRLELDWKQEKLALRSSGRLSQAQVSDIERNRYSNPTLQTLVGLATAFNVSLDALLAAAKASPGQIPSLAEALSPQIADLPDWVREFHYWAVQLSPAVRSGILNLARILAEEATEQKRNVQSSRE